MNQFTSDDLLSLEQTSTRHQLPALTYDYAALEPYIDARTMTLHHDIHHGGYVEKLNAALKKFPDFQKYSALWLLCNLDKVPEAIRTRAIRLAPLWALLRNGAKRIALITIWMNSSSALTVEPRALAACCSTAFCNRLLPPIQ